MAPAATAARRGRTQASQYAAPAITFVIFASGLKYVGVGTYALGWTIGAVLLAGAVYWLVWVRTRPWRREPAPVLAEAPADVPVS